MAVLLGILRIIGIILLALICIVVLLLAAVLLVPVRYRVHTRYQEGLLDTEGEITWFLRVIRAPFTFVKEIPGKKDKKNGGPEDWAVQKEPGLTWDIRVFRFSLKKFLNKDDGTDLKDNETDLPGEDFPEKDLPGEVNPKNDLPEEPAQTAGPAQDDVSGPKNTAEAGSGKNDVPQAESAERQDAVPERVQPDNKPHAGNTGKTCRRDPEKRMREGAKRKPSVKPGEKAADQTKPEVTVEIIHSRRPGPFEMRLARYGAFIGKLKKALRKGESLLDTVSAWLDYRDSVSFEKAVSLIIRELKAILKHILPRRLEGTVEYGTGDPALTGEILGGIAAFYPVLPPKLAVIPDFEEKKLITDTVVRGHIIIGVLIARALRLLISRDVRDLIARVRARDPADPAIRRAKNKEKKKAARAAARKRKQKKKKRMGKGGRGNGR